MFLSGKALVPRRLAERRPSTLAAMQLGLVARAQPPERQAIKLGVECRNHEVAVWDSCDKNIERAAAL